MDFAKAVGARVVEWAKAHRAATITIIVGAVAFLVGAIVF